MTSKLWCRTIFRTDGALYDVLFWIASVTAIAWRIGCHLETFRKRCILLTPDAQNLFVRCISGAYFTRGCSFVEKIYFPRCVTSDARRSVLNTRCLRAVFDQCFFTDRAFQPSSWQPTTSMYFIWFIAVCSKSFYWQTRFAIPTLKYQSILLTLLPQYLLFFYFRSYPARASSTEGESFPCWKRRRRCSRRHEGPASVPIVKR